MHVYIYMYVCMYVCLYKGDLYSDENCEALCVCVRHEYAPVVRFSANCNHMQHVCRSTCTCTCTHHVHVHVLFLHEAFASKCKVLHLSPPPPPPPPFLPSRVNKDKRGSWTYSCLLLALGVGEGLVAELKVPLAELEVAHSCATDTAGGLLEQGPTAQDKMVDVATVLCSHLSAHWREMQ